MGMEPTVYSVCSVPASGSSSCLALGSRHMKTKLTLEQATEAFFDLHWNDALMEKPRPKWRSWDLKGIPDEANKGGCYAIYWSDRLLYVGLALTGGK